MFSLKVEEMSIKLAAATATINKGMPIRIPAARIKAFCLKAVETIMGMAATINKAMIRGMTAKAIKLCHQQVEEIAI